MSGLEMFLADYPFMLGTGLAAMVVYVTAYRLARGGDDVDA